MGVNDLLNNKSPSSADDVVSSLVKIVNKCKSFGVMDLFVSRIAFNKRLPYAVIKKVNEKIVDMCKKFTHTLPIFRKEYTPSTPKILIKEGNIGLVSSGFEAIRENRLKYVNNP